MTSWRVFDDNKGTLRHFGDERRAQDHKVRGKGGKKGKESEGDDGGEGRPLKKAKVDLQSARVEVEEAGADVGDAMKAEGGGGAVKRPPPYPDPGDFVKDFVRDSEANVDVPQYVGGDEAWTEEHLAAFR